MEDEEDYNDAWEDCKHPFLPGDPAGPVAYDDIAWLFIGVESPLTTYFKAHTKAQEIFLQNEEERREKALLN